LSFDDSRFRQKINYYLAESYIKLKIPPNNRHVFNFRLMGRIIADNQDDMILQTLSAKLQGLPYLLSQLS
jgi:hypothetical protein